MKYSWDSSMRTFLSCEQHPLHSMGKTRTCSKSTLFALISKPWSWSWKTSRIISKRITHPWSNSLALKSHSIPALSDLKRERKVTCRRKRSLKKFLLLQNNSGCFPFCLVPVKTLLSSDFWNVYLQQLAVLKILCIELQLFVVLKKKLCQRLLVERFRKNSA